MFFQEAPIPPCRTCNGNHPSSHYAVSVDYSEQEVFWFQFHTVCSVRNSYHTAAIDRLTVHAQKLKFSKWEEKWLACFHFTLYFVVFVGI